MPEATLVPVKSWSTITQVKAWEPKDHRTTITAKNPEVVQKLTAALQNDFTVGEACDYAGLARSTFYEWLKQDSAFAEEMRKAKEFPKHAAKNRVMSIINKGTDREAGPMARWLLEKRQPEVYGQAVQPINNNNQNNFFILSNEKLSELTARPDIANSDPTELLEALEATPDVDARAEKEGVAHLD